MNVCARKGCKRSALMLSDYCYDHESTYFTFITRTSSLESSVLFVIWFICFFILIMSLILSLGYLAWELVEWVKIK